MIQKDELKRDVKELSSKLAGIAESLDVDALNKELAELNGQMHAEGFWNDVQTAQKVAQRAKNIEYKLEELEKLTSSLSGCDELLDMCGDDEAMLEETAAECERLKKEIGELYISTLLRGKYDANNAILTLHAGAGGTEAQDWTSMLYRMYTRYCERRGYKVVEMDMLPGDEAGIKSVTFQVNGVNAYGYLKAEKGVHRLVRISPFDANKRRHTSFASLEVMPEIDNDIDVVIEDKDLKVDTYRSSGAGGQHVNKTESAIRITHIPTGIVVACQDERSQIKNRDKAMKALRSKLYDFYRERADKEYSQTRKTQIGTGDRSERIRTYNFPQGRVTDHRIGLTLHSLDAFMDGDLDEMIEALRLADRTARLQGKQGE